MKAQKFTYKSNSDISPFWLEAAELVCASMPPMELADDLFEQDRQIWGYVERLCSEKGIDVHYWPENLIVYPV
ncbi:hypothetical protein JW998_04165 [candidate division KSB1 bacterium]|nr:hypothetical protein [candidate division KSB1 bacterium]